MFTFRGLVNFVLMYGFQLCFVGGIGVAQGIGFFDKLHYVNTNPWAVFVMIVGSFIISFFGPIPPKKRLGAKPPTGDGTGLLGM